MYKLRDLNTMGYKEIIQYLDDFPLLHKRDYGMVQLRMKS